MNTKYLITLFACALLSACNPAPAESPVSQADPLPSWNEGATKSSIIDFVQNVTDSASTDFVEVIDRIATFDNDGNMWSEQPLYFQLIFAMDRVKELAPEHPEWASTQPFQAVLEDDKEALLASGEHGLLELVMTTHAGMSPEEFEDIVDHWLSNTQHPRFEQPYNELIYQPMLELLDYLRANEFKTFIVSGGGIDFMRVWVEDAYGIPKDQVVGSSIKTELVMEGEIPVIKRLPEVDYFDDKEGKPIGNPKVYRAQAHLCFGKF